MRCNASRCRPRRRSTRAWRSSRARQGGRGEQLEPIPSVLESRTVRTKLPSGIELHTLRKQTRGNSVQVQIQAQWGDRDTTTSGWAPAWWGSCSARGTAQISKQQVRDAFIKAARGFWRESSGDQGVTVNLTAERDTLLPAAGIWWRR